VQESRDGSGVGNTKYRKNPHSAGAARGALEAGVARLKGAKDSQSQSTNSSASNRGAIGIYVEGVIGRS
jgi:hypothetical protein